MQNQQYGLLQIEVSGYKSSEFEKDVTYYVMEVNKRGQNKWTIEKRFSEFDDLYKNLAKLFGNIPKLPQKSFFKIKTTDQLEKRQQELDQFVKEILLRQDIYNSEPFKKFFQIENFAPETTMIPPKLLSIMSNFHQGVRDFFYQKDKGVLFSLISEMNVASRLDSYLTNMKMPWEKEEIPIIISLGSIECYIRVEDFKFEKVWTRSFKAQAICICWDQATSTLAIGLDDGGIQILKVSENYLKSNEVFNNQVHTHRVMAICIDSSSNQIFSISEDKTLKIMDLSSGQVTQSLTVSNHSLTNMVIDKELKRLFISDKQGYVFIWDISPFPPVLLNSLQNQGKYSIRGLCFDPIKNYIFSASNDGEICVFDVEKQGREKFAKQNASFKGKEQVNYVFGFNQLL